MQRRILTTQRRYQGNGQPVITVGNQCVLLCIIVFLRHLESFYFYFEAHIFRHLLSKGKTSVDVSCNTTSVLQPIRRLNRQVSVTSIGDEGNCCALRCSMLQALFERHLLTRSETIKPCMWSRQRICSMHIKFGLAKLYQLTARLRYCTDGVILFDVNHQPTRHAQCMF